MENETRYGGGPDNTAKLAAPSVPAAAGHTPERWRADYAGGYGQVGVYAGKRLLGTAHRENTDEADAERTIREAEANARLWAAAPDLLAALKWALDVVEDNTDADDAEADPQFMAAWKQAQAAIEAAEA